MAFLQRLGRNAFHITKAPSNCFCGREVFNQRNVELVDINEAPIDRVTARGIKPAGRNTSAESSLDRFLQAAYPQCTVRFSRSIFGVPNFARSA